MRLGFTRGYSVKSIADSSKLSTRELILGAIKQANEATVEELAEAAEVSPVTVRHHLNSLQADGLLETRTVRRKVGRPYYVYSISEKGLELFPQRYVRLSSRLLEELKSQFAPEIIAELFNGVVERIVHENRAEFQDLAFEGRLDFLVTLLAEEGFLASWEVQENEYVLTEYSCPYYSVGQRHSEVCHFDQELMRQVLRTEVEQHSCMISGDSCCQFTFTVPLNAIET
jgi:DeoR family transcriptional regulator, suf operon transcriptional repressor